MLNFLKTIFLMLKVHSCKSENLSVNSPTYDILEVHSTLVRFYHNVQYKQRKIRSYGKVEWFSIKITNLMDIFQIHHKYFNNYLSIAFQLPWLYHQGYKIFFHRSDIITKQNEILQKRQKNKLGKYMLYYSYDQIFCKIHALKVLLYWKISYWKLLKYSKV